MGKEYQESEVNFRKSPDGLSDYPESRGITVYHYGGTLEECIDKARHESKIGDEWEVEKAEL